MQKKIIALAVAAAFSAPAFAETTVYGVADLAVANISATGTKSEMTVISGGLSTSRFGIKHTEGLDNGMTAVAVLEYGLDLANNTTIGVKSTGAQYARQQMLALAGDFGTVAAGYLQTTGYDFYGKFDPTAGSAVDTAAAVNPSTLISSSARAAHAAAYISPNMNGMTFAYNHSFDVANVGQVATGTTTVAGNKTSANLFSLTYAAGPLSVGGVYASTANDGTGFAKTTDMGLGASFALDQVTLFGTYTSTKTDGGLGTDSAVAFHAVAPLAGVGTVVATYGKNTINSTAAADNTSGFTVALLKTLSKTTTGYAALQSLSKGTPATDTTVVAVGLRKKF